MRTVEILFSPTSGTEKVAHIIANRWGSPIDIIDLSRPKMDVCVYGNRACEDALVEMEDAARESSV